MSAPELVLVLRYRKAVTYGFHALLGALGLDEPADLALTWQNSES